MSFQWGLIKKWAEEKGYNPKKIKNGGYVWDGNNYEYLEDLVTDIWNHMTKNKWIEYQKQYALANGRKHGPRTT